MTAPDPRRAHTPPIPASQTSGPDTSRIDRTDDAAVPSREADALDAWLESADARWGSIAALNGQPSDRQNGHRPDGSTEDMSSLVATAREFHGRIGDAERERGPAVPETDIWERIMSDHLTSRSNQLPNGRGAISPGMAGSTITRHDPKPADVVPYDTPPKHRSMIVDILTGTHPAASILLAAAVVLAILAVFRSFDETRTEPVAPTAASLDGQSGASGSNVVIPGGFGSSAQGAGTPGTPATRPATPVASPTAGTSRWLRYPDLSDCTSQSVPAEPGTQAYDPLPGPLPFGPASSDDQFAAAEVYYQVQACEPLANLPEPQATGTNGLMTVDTSSLDSPLLSAELGFGFGQPGEPVSPELLRYVTALTDALPDQEPLDYIIEGDPLPASDSSGGVMTQSHRVILPEDIVRLADGRIGGPARLFFQTNVVGGAAAYIANQPFLETAFVILTVEDGRWVLDEYLTICIGDCELYWRSYRDQQWPGGTPPSVSVIWPLDATPRASLGARPRRR